MNLRHAVRDWTPPAVLRGWRRLRHRDSPSPEWEYVGRDWVAASDGWNSRGVVEAYRSKSATYPRSIARPASVGVPTEAHRADDASAYDQNVALEFAYAVARASAGRSQISILDWGGGFGLLDALVRELFPELDVEFHVREVPLVVDAGRAARPDVRFWDDDRCLEREFDLVNASSSLQYEPTWEDTLARLGRAGRWLLVTRLPVTLDDSSFVVRQRAYGTTYDGWVIGRTELLTAAARAGLLLDRELLEGWSATIPDAPGGNEHRAFLFNRAADGDETR